MPERNAYDLESLAARLAALLKLPGQVAALEATVRLLSESMDRLRRTVPPSLATVPEAAKALKVSVTTIRRLVRTRELPVVFVGRSPRIDLAAVRPLAEWT